MTRASAAIAAPHPNRVRSGRWSVFIAVNATILVTAFCVFVLPFFFPPTHISRSAAYSAGFNNRVACLALAAVMLAVFAASWRFRLYPLAPSQQDSRPIPRLFLWIALVLCLLFNGWLGWMLSRANGDMFDPQYFLEALDNALRYHQHLYTGFNFAYGPLLFYLPLAIHALLAPFHTGTQGAYYIALALCQALGLILLYFTLQVLPLTHPLRIVAFCLFALAAFNPVMGLNYTLIRALLPFSTLLFAARAKSPFILATFLFLGQVLQLSVSPELGFAFAAGACFYALLLTLRRGLAWIVALVTPLVASVFFLAIVPRGYLHTFLSFSQGGFNILIEPLGYILLFLVAAAWLVPTMLAKMFREHQPDALLLAALAVVALALLPVALGRCDPLHMLYGDMPIYLLAVCALPAYPRAAQNFWWVFFFGVVLWTQTLNFILHPGVRRAWHIVYQHTPRADTIDIPRLRAIVGNGKIFAPFQIPLNVEQEFKDAGLYQPDRESFDMNVTDPEEESAKISRMDRNQWALVPLSRTIDDDTPNGVSVGIGVGYTFYPIRQAPYLFGKAIDNDLKTNWTPVAVFGKWRLYRGK